MCPLCNETHDVLITYQLAETTNVLFEGDFVTNLNSNKQLSFIAAHGFCDGKRYDVKVGINNDKLTDIIIGEQNGKNNY